MQWLTFISDRNHIWIACSCFCLSQMIYLEPLIIQTDQSSQQYYDNISSCRPIDGMISAVTNFRKKFLGWRHRSIRYSNALHLRLSCQSIMRLVKSNRYVLSNANSLVETRTSRGCQNSSSCSFIWWPSEVGKPLHLPFSIDSLSKQIRPTNLICNVASSSPPPAFCRLNGPPRFQPINRFNQSLRTH